MKTPSIEAVKAFVLTSGAAVSADIMKAFGVSKPTAVKLLKEAGAVAMGNSVSRSYALPKPIGGIGAKWNLYIVGKDAGVEKIGVLHSTSAGFFLESAKLPALLGEEFKGGLFPSLPWFIYEHRPQGFIGRNIVRSLGKSFGFSGSLKDWSDADILEFSVRFGSDLSGALIVGDAAKSEFLNGRGADLKTSERAKKYPELALEAVSNGIAGSSSAGGEQPKFCALVEDAKGAFRNVIVKFSGETGSPESRRWADLLVCEFTALKILKKYRLPAAKAELFFSKKRAFLEYQRIDRIGRYGRLATSSLSGIDAAFIGASGGSWAEAMRAAKSLFSEKDISAAERAYNFGLAIGNTDMHFGNISFYIGRGVPFELAPIYDMLPMRYAPLSDGTLLRGALKSIPPTPQSRAMAKDFWLAVAADRRVSGEFRKIAKSNAAPL